METEHLSCKTPTCRSTAQNISASAALAPVGCQSQLRPGFVPTAGFERCNRTSSYSSDEVIGLIPPDRRPAPLQQDHSRIFISFEKFKKAAALKPYCGTAETPVMTLHCEACRTPGLIDERSFAGPYRGTFRNSRNDVGAA